MVVLALQTSQWVPGAVVRVYEVEASQAASYALIGASLWSSGPSRTSTTGAPVVLAEQPKTTARLIATYDQGPMTDQLATAGHTFARLADAYGWVDITRFRLPGGTDDRAALAALIAHELYGSNHAGGEPGTDPARHGPYWRDRITPDSFDRVSTATAEAELPASADLHGYVSAATRVYRLRDLSEAVHDWGWVLWEFQEFVLIGQDEVVLVIAAID